MSHHYQESEPAGGMVPAIARLPRRTVFKWFVAVAAAPPIQLFPKNFCFFSARLKDDLLQE